MRKKTRFSNKQIKTVVCAILVFTLTIGSIVVFPKRTEADLAVSVAQFAVTSLAKVTIGVLDAALVKSLDYAAVKTGNNVFKEIADIYTLPSKKASRKSQEMFEEVLAQIDALSQEVNAQNIAVQASISELSKQETDNQLSSKHESISKINVTCNNVMDKYENYVNSAKVYADAVDAYNSNKTDSNNQKMNTAKEDVDTHLEAFVNTAKSIDFEGLVDTLGIYTCIYAPRYLESDPNAKGNKLGVNTDLYYVNQLADKTYAFEHQKHRTLSSEMNWIASVFTNILTAHSTWMDYQASAGLISESAESLARKTVANKVVQGINDVSEQFDGFTKSLMRDYDTTRTVSMNYQSYGKYSDTRWTVNFVIGTMPHFLNADLSAVDSKPSLSFFHVKPINQKYPFLILINGVHQNGPMTEEHFAVQGSALPDPYIKFSCMDMDFYNLTLTNDKSSMFRMPTDIDDFSRFIQTGSFGLYNGDIMRYITEGGGLDAYYLPKSPTIAILNKWEKAGTQATEFCNYYSTYYGVKLTGVNTATLSKSVTPRKGDKIYKDNVLVLMIGQSSQKVKGDAEVSLDTSIKFSQGGSDFTATSQVSAVFRSTNRINKGVGLLSKKTGKVMDVLVDPDTYDILKDKNGNVEFNFSVPYQDFQLVSIDAGKARQVYAERKKSSDPISAMSAFEADGVDTMSTDTADSSEAAVPETGVAEQSGSQKMINIDLTSDSSVPEFTDIQGHPAEADIEYLASLGMITGANGTEFSPDTPMTRGMLVTALVGLTDADLSQYNSSNFGDISTKSQFRQFSEWAYKNGIVFGSGNWQFEPNEPITREQMAVILKRFADKAGIMSSEIGEAQHLYSDDANISEWAKDSVYALQPLGIMGDKSDSAFNPKGIVTKAEAAVMLSRFIHAKQ